MNRLKAPHTTIPLAREAGSWLAWASTYRQARESSKGITISQPANQPARPASTPYFNRTVQANVIVPRSKGKAPAAAPLRSTGPPPPAVRAWQSSQTAYAPRGWSPAPTAVAHPIGQALEYQM